ncbi:Multidrug resistance-associated protein 1, partial [Entomortierella beljakovae]
MGRVSWGIYGIYLRAASYRNTLIGVIIFLFIQACQIGANLWLEHWANISSDDKQSPDLFLGVYAAIMVVYMLLNYAVTYVFMIWIGMKATAKLHDDLLNSILRLPMIFFDTTPLGRIVNRFSTDIFATDNSVPWVFMCTIMYGISVLGTIVVIGTATPIFLVMVPPLAFLFILVQ